jgi:hypothetical protein
MGRTEDLEQQVKDLTRVIEDMKTRVNRLEAADEAVAESEPPRKTRRNFLKLGAATALGAVGAVAARAIPAAAADGATVTTGNTVTGEHPTIIAGDAGTAVPVLEVRDSTFVSGSGQAALTAAGGFLGAVQGKGGDGSAGSIEGVDGWAQGPLAYGVYGLSDSGTGVVGESNTGLALHARRSGRIRQDPLLAAPAYPPADFEQVRDPNGNLWISQSGGVWRQVTIMNLFPDPRRVWDGFVGPTAPGVYGPVDAKTIVASQGGGASGVPLGAKAAWCAVMSYQAGVMTIFPDGTTEPVISNWTNGSSGALGIFYMFVPLSPAGKFNFHAFFTGNRFFDVWGYLL